MLQKLEACFTNNNTTGTPFETPALRGIHFGENDWTKRLSQNKDRHKKVNSSHSKKPCNYANAKYMGQNSQAMILFGKFVNNLMQKSTHKYSTISAYATEFLRITLLACGGCLLRIVVLYGSAAWCDGSVPDIEGALCCWFLVSLRDCCRFLVGLRDCTWFLPVGLRDCAWFLPVGLRDSPRFHPVWWIQLLAIIAYKFLTLVARNPTLHLLSNFKGLNTVISLEHRVAEKPGIRGQKPVIDYLVRGIKGGL